MRCLIALICYLICIISYGNDIIISPKIFNNTTAQGVADIQAQRKRSSPN
jgi:hypothetical protein